MTYIGDEACDNRILHYSLQKEEKSDPGAS